MQRYNNRTGFSLIELMVVLAIIAILGLLAMPDLSANTTRKQIRESLEKVERYKAAVQTLHEERVYVINSPEFADLKDSVALKPGNIHNPIHLFPINNEEVPSMPAADKIIGNYINHVQLKNGVMTLTFSQHAHGAIQGKKLSLIPSYVKDAYDQELDWVCGYTAIPEGKLGIGKNETNIDKKYLPSECW